MNRKERRFAEKAQEKKTGFKVPSTSDVAKAEVLKAQGVAMKASGKEAEAIPLLIEALKLNSSLADVHFMLAIMARTKPELKVNMVAINNAVKNKTELKDAYKAIQDVFWKRKLRQENLICQEEVCRLLPHDENEKAEYAIMLNTIGRKEEALRILADLLNNNPDNKLYKGIFVSSLDQVALTKHEPEIKKALQYCFDNIYETNLHKAFPLWVNLIVNDPAYISIHAIQNKIQSGQLDQWINGATPEELSFARDDFFLSGLRLLIISALLIEDMLMHMRRWLCMNIENPLTQTEIKAFEPFIFALGEQSFFNEYLYTQTQAETEIIDSLISRIHSNAIPHSELPRVYGLISCYQLLHKVFPDRRDELRGLADKSADFAKLFKTQFLDIEEENNIKSSLKSFGMLENEISKNVQSQYEENPYPRWISCMNYPVPNYTLPMDEKSRHFNSWQILIAGCGTGRHALNTAATYPNGNVTAIDLSRASLAYGQRKAQEAGLAGKIDFIHSDILSMDRWPEQFDIIESSGVLHHMEDPFKGWSLLCDRLKPGGYFKLGFYSEIARTEVVKARDYIKDMGFEPSIEGMRACRETIKQRPASDSLKKWMTNSTDFYSTSSLRDLIFHVQEHRMNLPQLQEMMDKLGLVFIKFILNDSQALQLYDARFPGDPERKNLGNWYEFEQKNPDTFKNMYQFWCQKR